MKVLSRTVASRISPWASTWTRVPSAKHSLLIMAIATFVRKSGDHVAEPTDPAASPPQVTGHFLSSGGTGGPSIER